MQSNKKSSNGTEPVAWFLRPRALGWSRVEVCAVPVGLPEQQEHSSVSLSTEHIDGLHNQRPAWICPCRQLYAGLPKCNGVLHDCIGICHGDFTPSNILLKVAGLDGLPEDQVLKILGDPVKVEVFTESGQTPSDPTAPRYLVRPVEFRNVPLPYIVDEILVIDFGESYDVTNPPEELGIPESYRPPELLLENTPGFGCDLWALGCTLFEIRTGRKLFDMFDDDVDSHLFHMVRMLGPLPEPWWSTTWQRRKEFFKDETDSLGRAVMVDALSKEQPDEMTEHRSIEWALRRGLHYWDLGPGEEFGRDIPPDEVEQLADLLKKILQYEPSRRLTVAEALEHEWFRLDGK